LVTGAVGIADSTRDGIPRTAHHRSISPNDTSRRSRRRSPRDSESNAPRARRLLTGGQTIDAATATHVLTSTSARSEDATGGCASSRHRPAAERDHSRAALPKSLHAGPPAQPCGRRARRALRHSVAGAAGCDGVARGGTGSRSASRVRRTRERRFNDPDRRAWSSIVDRALGTRAAAIHKAAIVCFLRAATLW